MSKETKNRLLVGLVSELIEILDEVEESDMGREFHPTTIQSCRCSHVARLGKIMPKIKLLCQDLIKYEETATKTR